MPCNGHFCLQVAYDSSKQALLQLGMPDNVGLHFSAGLSAGLAATLLGSPWDVIGTRLMAQSESAGISSASLACSPQDLPMHSSRLPQGKVST